MTLVRHFAVIAGHVEHEERVTQALVREAAEEAGIQFRASEQEENTRDGGGNH